MTDYIDLQKLRSIDSLPIRGVGPEHLDPEKTAEHITRAVERRRYRGPAGVEAFWKNTGCLAEDDNDLCTTIAGIMCFGRNPQSVFPNAIISLVHYAGSYVHSNEVLNRDRIDGTIFDQASRVQEYLFNNMRKGMNLENLHRGSLEREDVYQWPLPAVREALVNLLGHRDYTQRGVVADVLMFPTHILMTNPGGLPAGVTVDRIAEVHESRNPIIAEILRQAGLGEEAGQGVDTILREYERARLPRPQFEDLDHKFFRVTLVGRAPETFYEGGVYAKLTDRQRRILAIVRTLGGQATAQQITGQLNTTGDPIQHRQVNRETTQLIEIGLLRRVGGSHQTQYELTENTPTQASFFSPNS